MAESLIDCRNFISWETVIAEAYKPSVNRYVDRRTNECAATPKVGSIAEVERAIPTIVSPRPAKIR